MEAETKCGVFFTHGLVLAVAMALAGCGGGGGGGVTDLLPGSESGFAFLW